MAETILQGPNRYKYKQRKNNILLPLISPEISAAELLFNGKIFPVPICSLRLTQDGQAYFDFRCFLENGEEVVANWRGPFLFVRNGLQMEMSLDMFEFWDPPWPVITAVARFSLTERGIQSLEVFHTSLM